MHWTASRREPGGLRVHASMPRPVWTGSVGFGLVNVPVKAFSAVRDHDVHFHQIDKKTGARIRTGYRTRRTGRWTTTTSRWASR